MPTFREQMAADLSAIYGEQGESVTYIPISSSPYPLTAIFRSLTADDLVSEHVRADAVVCEIREAELQAPPSRGDCLERSQPFGLQSLEVVDRSRDESGIWKLFCQQNIRVVP